MSLGFYLKVPSKIQTFLTLSAINYQEGFRFFYKPLLQQREPGDAIITLKILKIRPSYAEMMEQHICA